MKSENSLKISDKNREKEKKRLMIMYCLTFFGNGIYNSFFGTYESMLETDVYMMPVVLVGIIEVLSQAVKWIISPLLGAFMDNFKFKHGKFWPWMYLGITIMLVSHVTVFALPALTNNVRGVGFVILFFVLQCGTSLAAPMYTTSVNAVYPKISTDPNDRATMAAGQKMGRDLSKTLFGVFIPTLIIFFTDKLGSQANAYAVLAVILGVLAFSPYISLATALKGSYVEEAALEQSGLRENQSGLEKITLKKMFKVIFQNRILLTIFSFMIIQNGYYFLIQISSTYLFKYVFNSFEYYGIFTTAFNFAAVGGAAFGVWLNKRLDDLKKSFLLAGAAHIVCLLIAACFFKYLQWWSFCIIIACAQFFEGTFEAYYLPIFGIAADAGAVKTGKRQDALIMSTYTMSITIGLNLSTLIRTYLLNKVGYDAAAYNQGITPTIEVKNMLANMNTIIPACMAVIAMLIIYFGFNLTKKDQEDLIKQLDEMDMKREKEFELEKDDD